MIAKGTTHNNGARLATYMTTAKEGERATLWQLRGFAAEDIKDAFRSVHVMAEATQCDKPFFHVQVRNPEGEQLTLEQWQRVADRIEAKLGYGGQPRAMAFHVDEATGHEHLHVAWSRIDDETMTARPLPFFKLRLKEVSRELEQELGLTPVRNEREGHVMAAKRGEEEQARRLDVDLKDVRHTIRDCYEHADGGKAFAAALAHQGLTLAQGERRDFVVIDQAGGLHALGKRVLGTTAAQTRERLADLDRGALPTVEEARQNLADRAPEITQPVIDMARDEFFDSVAERRAEREAMLPAQEALDAVGHGVEQAAGQLADVGETVAGGIGRALGGALSLVEGPINFVIDFLAGGSSPPPVTGQQRARESEAAPSLREREASTLARAAPEEVVNNPETARAAAEGGMRLDEEQRAAIRRQAEEIAARQRENWDDRER